MNSLPLLRVIRTLTPPAIEEMLVRERVLRRAQAYASEGRVEEVWIDGRALRAHVSGSSTTPYHSVLRLIEGQIESECSCPYERGICWHAGAVLLALVAEPELIGELEEQAGRRVSAPVEDDPGEDSSDSTAEETSAGGDLANVSVRNAADRQAAMASLRDELLAWPKLDMIELLSEAAVDDPIVENRIRQHLSDLTSIDIRLYRQSARSALRPGSLLARFELPRVAADLEQIAASVQRLLAGSQPEAALGLLEEIAALAWERMSEVDDRDGALLESVRKLLRQWCRGWAEVPERDRQVLARRIFGWLMEDGVNTSPGLVHEARQALGPIGLDTLSGLLRPVLEQRQSSRPAALGGDEFSTLFDPVVERARSALREIAEVRGDAEEYLALCDTTGEHGADILAAARRFEALGQAGDALLWAERGRRKARGTVRYELEDLRISLLYGQGRRREAIEAAWEMLSAEPSAAGYRRLMDVAGEADRGEWRRRALDQAEAGADATAFTEICLAANESERLAHRLDSSPGFVLSSSPVILERAATLLCDRFPLIAARIRMHLASHLLASGDARHYARVRAFLETARESYESEGEAALWEESLARIREAHSVVKAWYP